MGGSSSTPAQPQNQMQLSEEDQRAMKMAHQELEALTDMYHRMSDQCFRKCISHYNDSELSKGESVCIERCVHKYIEMQRKIGERISQIK